MLILFMFFQILCCCLLYLKSSDQDELNMSHASFLLTVGGLFGACGACGVLVTVLALEVFSPENSGMVIGLLSGIFDGLTTLVFTALIISLAPPIKKISGEAMEYSRQGYAQYFLYCVVLSILGLLGSVFLSRCRLTWR